MDDLNKALEKQAKKAMMTKKSALAFLRRAGIVAVTGTELATRYRGGEEKPVRPTHPPYPDVHGHRWVDRGTCVCPYVCSECGALSGTDKASSQCRGNEEKLRIVRECFRKDVYEMWYSACENFAYAIDHTPSVSLSSDPSEVEKHPAYKALVSLGILALEYIRVDGSDTWWKLIAADEIMKGLGIKYDMPKYMAGKLEEQSQHLRIFLLKKVFSKNGPLHKYTVAPDNCACGKKGKWIADGISRFGYYCKKCSDKALENA